MTELVLLFVVALLVLGPDKLPDFARRAGGFVRRLRQQAEAARRMVEDELALGEHGDAFNELRRLRGEVAQLRAVVSNQAQQQQWWLPATADQPSSSSTQEHHQGTAGSGATESTSPMAPDCPAGLSQASETELQGSPLAPAGQTEAVRLHKDQRDLSMASAVASQPGHEGRTPPHS